MADGITWYDILGVLPGASAWEIQQAYEDKAGLLRPQLIAGAPPAVVAAASRAQGILDAARRVLGDPADRERYDLAAGIQNRGGGLAGPDSYPSEPGWDTADFGFVAGRPGADVLAGLMLLADWLAPHPRVPGRIAVPDVRGLFYSVCFEVMGRLGLRLTAVRLTEHPMPVDGLIVGQSPRPPARLHREDGLTVQIWHPPARPPQGGQP
ncbi:MAG TPA: J domain-containing protein [Streptosporangiaceae bacterium]